jgi:hypothetical protein
MADDYTRGGETFRAKEVSAKKTPIMLAGEHVRVHDGIQSVTLTTTAGLALTVPGGATHALIYCEGAADTDFARYWHGSTNPSASVGKRLNDHEEIATAAPAAFRAVIGQGSPILRVEYYHYE